MPGVVKNKKIVAPGRVRDANGRFRRPSPQSSSLRPIPLAPHVTPQERPHPAQRPAGSNALQEGIVKQQANTSASVHPAAQRRELSGPSHSNLQHQPPPQTSIEARAQSCAPQVAVQTITLSVSKYEDIREKHNTTLDRNRDLRKTIEKLQISVDKLQRVTQAGVQANRKLQAELTNVKAKNEDLEDDIAKLEEIEETERNNDELEERIGELEERVEVLEDESESLEVERDELQERVQELEELLRCGWSYGFQRMVQTKWQSRHYSRYTRVKVLLVSWESDDLGCYVEVQALGKVFRNCYNFEVDEFLIPDNRPSGALTRRVNEFIDGSTPETLLIFYYTGHGGVNPSRNNHYWASTKFSGSTMPSSGIQTLLEEVQCDAILIHDACSSADTAMMPESFSESVTELIAACGFSDAVPVPGKHSFTNALVQELRSASRSGTEFSVSQLFNRLLSRLSYNPDGKVLSKTPVHCNLTFEKHRRHIMLQPLPAGSNGLAGYQRRGIGEDLLPSRSIHDKQRRLNVAFTVKTDYEGTIDGWREWQEWILKAPANALKVHFQPDDDFEYKIPKDYESDSDDAPNNVPWGFSESD